MGRQVQAHLRDKIKPDQTRSDQIRDKYKNLIPFQHKGDTWGHQARLLGQIRPDHILFRYQKCVRGLHQIRLDQRTEEGPV